MIDLICPSCLQSYPPSDNGYCLLCQVKLIKLPRKKHSHRCSKCKNSVYCYKKDCIKPQKIAKCQYCQ